MSRDVFQALADPTRRAIVALVSRRRLNVNAVARKFDMSRPAVSQHLRVLEESGLIVIQQEGRERFCEVQGKKLKEVADWVNAYRQLWEDRYTRLDDLLEKLQRQKGKKK